MQVADGNESETSSERKRNNIERGKEHKCRVEELLERFRPEKATTYDEDCMDLCIPFNQYISKAKYKEIVEEPAKVDQVTSILVRYNKLDPSVAEELSFVLPQIDAFDFARYRDGEVELRHLRNKVLGIPDNFIVNLEDIDANVALATGKTKHDVKPNDQPKTPVGQSPTKGETKKVP